MFESLKEKINNLFNRKNNKEKLLKDLLTVQFEMGYQSGRWATNECIFTDVAQDEIDYITGDIIKKMFPNFKYEYEPSEFEPYAEEDYNGCVLSKEEFQAIVNAEEFVNKDNYLIIDAIASDIYTELQNYVFKQLFN